MTIRSVSAQELQTRRIELRMIVFHINELIQTAEAQLEQHKQNLAASLGALQEIEHWIKKMADRPQDDLNLGVVVPPEIRLERAA